MIKHYNRKGEKMGNKKAQVTIFIILAIVIVMAFVLFFILIRNIQPDVSSTENIQGYVKNCLKTSLEAENKILLDSSFYPSRNSNYIFYNGMNVSYLCKASKFYTPCVNQEPMLSEYLRLMIYNATKKNMEKCFSQLTQNLKDKSYEVNQGNLTLTIDLFDEKIQATAEKEITLKKGEDIRTFKKFSTSINSPLYKLAYHTRSIINFESTLCEFNNVRWIQEYPDIKINKFISSDQSKVYILTDRNTEEKIYFAVKTCVLPAGI